MRHRLLLVDDEQSMLEFLRVLFEEEGYQVDTADSVQDARARVAAGAYDLVLSDILMPDGNGLELLREIKDGAPETAVIMMTAYTSTRSAIEAMKLGAYNYISKPFDVDELKVVARGALEKTGLQSENVYLRRELEGRYQFGNIVGRSPRMREIFSVVERVAKTTSTVLLHGESGTGKELVARAIHFSGPRKEQRFLSINCGALPENLLESELFGHEKGAFTGAVRDKKGLFQEASGGTLLLDEIGEMSPSMQVKLLRALQEKSVRRVGSNREESIDVRIVAATNQDLEKLIASGDFREDLFYRVNVIPVHMPPLRQRREDIPLLVEHFLNHFASEMEQQRREISVEAMQALENYDWPGNVRELENTVERALALSTRDRIDTSDLPARIAGAAPPQGGVTQLPADGLDLEAYLDEIRTQMMQQALERTANVQTQAAELLGMSFRSFRYYAKKLGLTGSSEHGVEAEAAPARAGDDA